MAKDLTGLAESGCLFFSQESFIWTQIPSVVNTELEIWCIFSSIIISILADWSCPISLWLQNEDVYTYSFSHIILDSIPKNVTRYTPPYYISESHCLPTPSARFCIYYPPPPKSQSFPHTPCQIWQPHLCFPVHAFLLCRGLHLCICWIPEWRDILGYMSFYIALTSLSMGVSSSRYMASSGFTLFFFYG